MWIKTFEEYRKSDWVDSDGKKIEYKGRADKISLEKAVDLYKKNCSDWDLKNEKKIYRGLWINSDYFYTNPKGKYRSSANADNTYNSLFDVLKSWEKAPKRSESLIMTNDLTGAESFGDVYVMIPYNGTKIGICSKCDVWNSMTFMESIIAGEYYGMDSLDSELSSLFKQITKGKPEYKHLIKSNSWEDYKGETVTRHYLSVNNKTIVELCEIVDSIPKDQLPTNYGFSDEELMIVKIWINKFPNMKFLEFMEHILDFNKNGMKVVNNQTDLLKSTGNCNEMWSSGEFIGIDEDEYDEFVKLIYNT
ncbi:MAG: hypothetical protein SLAVMIC_00565 [uncultured marine phage]|uniref:Uncharacterized protein n=1 Tax=uncultured marine phage TaxID=707152 RepID=A0A8D9CBS2_9VIRU|nr:MAG: hypothetical protein SLAVMIC_00565 [uncultured marine phage]